MESFERDIFRTEIERQCRYAVVARTKMLEALAGQGIDAIDAFWFWTQALLAAAANVSKHLWGVNDDRADEPRRPSREPER